MIVLSFIHLSCMLFRYFAVFYKKSYEETERWPAGYHVVDDSTSRNEHGQKTCYRVDL